MDGHENNVAVVKAAAETYGKMREAWDVFSILDGSVMVDDETVDKLAQEIAACGDALNAALEERERLIAIASAS